MCFAEALPTLIEPISIGAMLPEAALIYDLESEQQQAKFEGTNSIDDYDLKIIEPIREEISSANSESATHRIDTVE